MVDREMAMCRACGHFVEVLEKDGGWTVMEDECPECGGVEFKKNDTGEVIKLSG